MTTGMDGYIRISNGTGYPLGKKSSSTGFLHTGLWLEILVQDLRIPGITYD